MPEIGLLVLSRIVFLFFLCSASFAQVFPDSLIHKKLNEGIRLILSQDYPKAEQTFRRIKNENPKLPLGYIFLAVNEMTKSLDYYTPFDDELISSYLDSALEISDNRISENENIIWNYYFKALANGYYAYFEALKGNYFSALKNGLKSINDFDESLVLDTKFYEAYIAIGTFYYWSSSKSLGLPWLPFKSGRSIEGIKMLKYAISHKTYNYYIAVYSLCWIYIDNKEPEKAVELAYKALDEYPNSRLFSWVLAAALKRFDKERAIEKYQSVLNSFKKEKNTNFVKVVLNHKIAMLDFELGKYSKSMAICDKILRQIKLFSSSDYERIVPRIERVKYLKDESARKMQK